VHVVESIFEISGLGEPVDFLGIEIQRNRGAGTITLTQNAKAEALATVHVQGSGGMQGSAQSRNVSRVLC
jgi:hypothetical protein